MGFGRRGDEVPLLPFGGLAGGMMVRESRAVGPALMGRFCVSTFRLGRIASVVDSDLATGFGGVCGFAPMERIASVVDPDQATIFGGEFGSESMGRLSGSMCRLGRAVESVPTRTS